MECGEAVSLPTEEGVWEGDFPPSPEIKKKFLGSMCSKNFCVQAKGGGHRPVPPPKYATAPQYFTLYRRRGVVVSGVRRMNEVNARRARLVPGWVTVFGRVYHLGM